MTWVLLKKFIFSRYFWIALTIITIPLSYQVGHWQGKAKGREDANYEHLKYAFKQAQAARSLRARSDLQAASGDIDSIDRRGAALGWVREDAGN